jgi:hypothetical protein
VPLATVGIRAWGANRFHDLTVEYVAGSTGFVACTDLPPSCPTVKEPAKSTQVMGKQLDELGPGSVVDVEGNHDGVLVDVNPDANDGARRGAGPPVGCDLACRMWHWPEAGLGPR